MQGALISAGLLRTVRLLRKTIDDPKELVVALNAELIPELLPEQFVTVCMGTLDTNTNLLKICLAGHHPCMLLNPQSDVVLRRLGKAGMVLGIVEGETFERSLSVEEYQMERGDTLVQCTDGIIEATNDAMEEYGVIRMAARMLIYREQGRSCQTLLQRALDEAEKFAHGQLDDDITMWAIRAKKRSGDEGEEVDDRA